MLAREALRELERQAEEKSRDIPASASSGSAYERELDGQADIGHSPAASLPRLFGRRINLTFRSFV